MEVFLTGGDSTIKKLTKELLGSDDLRENYASRYAAWKSTGENKIEGTPLDQWPVLNIAQVKNLQSVEIHSIEQLAAVGEEKFQDIGLGARELREKAKAWIGAAEGNAAITQLAAEKAQLEEKVKVLEQQVKEIADLKKKKGKKKNEENS